MLKSNRPQAGGEGEGREEGAAGGDGEVGVGERGRPQM